MQSQDMLIGNLTYFEGLHPAVKPFSKPHNVI